MEFYASSMAESCDLDEDTVMDVEADGQIGAIPVEHASTRAGIPQFSYELVT